jgi:hypothetical protein
MINNNICENCQHKLVCSKQTVLAKFKDDNKGFLGMDISIERCVDEMPITEE